MSSLTSAEIQTLLADAAGRAGRYLAGLDERPVAPDDAALAGLARFNEPLPDLPGDAAATLALLDEAGSPATMASTGGRYFGFVIGGSAGTGAINFHGRVYPLAIGGVSYGFTFGASATDFVGTVSNIRTPYDVNGIYAAAGAGAAVGIGGGAIVLTNQNGAVLTLSGRQAGLIVAADLNGLIISLR